MAAGCIDNGEQVGIDASLGHQVLHPDPVPANFTGMPDLYPRIGKGKRLVQSLAARVHLVIRARQRLSRLYEVGHCINIVDAAGTKIRDFHREISGVRRATIAGVFGTGVYRESGTVRAPVNWLT